MIAYGSVAMSMYILKTGVVHSLTPVKSRVVRCLVRFWYVLTFYQLYHGTIFLEFSTGFEHNIYSACGKVENFIVPKLDFLAFWYALVRFWYDAWYDTFITGVILLGKWSLVRVLYALVRLKYLCFGTLLQNKRTLSVNSAFCLVYLGIDADI